MQPPVVRSNAGPLGLPWWAWMIAAAIYVVSPIDLIPEFPLGCIGFVDDLGAVAFGVFCLVRMLSGAGSPVGPPPTAMVQEPRTVMVESRQAAPVLLAAPVVHEVVPEPILAPSPGRPGGVFAVQVIDDDGGIENIEVEARDADHARACVAELGADGKIGKVRLKRLLSGSDSAPRQGGVS